jgi:hypothetical protein
MAHQTKRRRASASDEARDREVIASALANGRQPPPPPRRVPREPQPDEVRRLDGGPVTDFNPTWRGDERGEVM